MTYGYKKNKFQIKHGMTYSLVGYTRSKLASRSLLPTPFDYFQLCYWHSIYAKIPVHKSKTKLHMLQIWKYPLLLLLMWTLMCFNCILFYYWIKLVS